MNLSFSRLLQVRVSLAVGTVDSMVSQVDAHLPCDTSRGTEALRCRVMYIHAALVRFTQFRWPIQEPITSRHSIA